MAPRELLREAEKDEVFYRHSGGGVTLTGGEPFLQPAFVREFFCLCKGGGIHTAVETAGFVPFENIESSLAFTDLFLYDLKHVDPGKHKEWTGADNHRITRNLRLISEKGGRIVLRVPVVPGFNYSVREMQSVVDFARDLGTVAQIDLLPYHSFGMSKYRRLRRPYRMKDAGTIGLREMEELRAELKNHGMELRIDV
jgi:pyruvate formate lyase activating enzyme